MTCLSTRSYPVCRGHGFINAESAHAQSQREGVNLSLISADSLQFETVRAMQFSGIPIRYGNNSMTGRTLKEIVHCKAVKAKAKAKEGSIDGQKLAIALDLLKNGMPKELVEEYLSHKMSKD